MMTDRRVSQCVSLILQRLWFFWNTCCLTEYVTQCWIEFTCTSHCVSKNQITPLHTFKPYKYTYTSPKCSQTPLSGISGHFRTTTDTNRHQRTPTDVARHPKRLFKDLWRFMLTSNGVCRGLMVSNDVPYCLMLSADVKRVSKKFLKGYLSAVYGFI